MIYGLMLCAGILPSYGWPIARIPGMRMWGMHCRLPGAALGDLMYWVAAQPSAR
jgi:hypothetical protein